MSNSVLSGSLKFLSLGDILQLLGSNSSTGALNITSKYTQDPGVIYIIDGNPADASTGSATGLDALNALFGWIDGEYSFSEEKVTCKKVIKKSRMELILDGLSMLDDGQIEKLGPVSFDEKGTDTSKKTSPMPIIKGPLVDYMYVVDEEEFYKDSQIVAEGKHGNWYWVIMEGIAEVAKETEDGPVKILRIGEGAFVGSIASFLIQGSTRSATITAIENVQLGVLDSQRLAIDFSRMSKEFRNVVLSLDKRLKEITDKAVDIYLNNDEVSEFLKEKKPVLKQGSSEEKIFIITEGTAHIVRHTEYGYVLLADLGRNDFFGNIPFIDMGLEPHSASVLGSEDLKYNELNLEELQKEHSKLSATFKNIIEHLATCVSVTTVVACNFKKKKQAKNNPKNDKV